MFTTLGEMLSFYYNTVILKKLIHISHIMSAMNDIALKQNPKDLYCEYSTGAYAPNWILFQHYRV